ncbi:MAG: hypothetical protein KTR18_16930 [Acidiferrobacterales bacterium]|nr:hypothetical protein [Acidiferrobacterales bacterium]
MNAPEDQIDQLKQLLFKEELERVETISEELNDDLRLEKQMEPILEKRIAELQAEFPDQFGPIITATLKVQIKESQDEVVEAIYPIMGKLIKKFIQKEIAMLSESIDQRIKEIFSFKATIRRWIAGLKGVTPTEMVVSGLVPPILEEVMVIENDSGLLIAKHSVGTGTDPDLVAGMLTAIKAFVEDAYGQSNQSLELIEYETFTLYLQSFKSFYIVAAVSGVMNQEFKDKLNDAIFSFAVKITGDKRYQRDGSAMTMLIEQHFSPFSTVALPEHTNSSQLVIE